MDGENVEKEMGRWLCFGAKLSFVCILSILCVLDNLFGIFAKYGV